MSADTRLALGFAAFYVFGGCVMLLLSYVLRRSDVETCERCGDSEDVEGGLCAACFEAAPVGVWF